MGLKKRRYRPFYCVFIWLTLGYSLDAVNHLLLKESGMLGLTGFSDLEK
jgi:acetate kinase